MKKVTAKECQQAARTLWGYRHYWKQFQPTESIMVVQCHSAEDYSIVTDRYVCAGGTSINYMDEVQFWFSNKEEAQQFCLKYLDSAIVE